MGSFRNTVKKMFSSSGIYFRSFSSGSSGNCYYLGTREDGILIDAGVGIRTLKSNLAAMGVSPESIRAILVTHDQFDHIRSLGSYCKRLQKPVWMTGTLRKALAINWMTGEYLAPVARILPPDGPADIIPGHVKARPFIVPHDATQTVGYDILFEDYPFVIMTDIGAMTDEALDCARKARTVVIEANYDPDMLRHGSYPVDLQERIRGGRGHLSNDECAEAIGDFMHEGLDNIFLCHLSANNNTPELAQEAAGKAVGDNHVRLAALPRTSPSALFEL